MTSSNSSRFVRITVRARDAGEAERAAAEAFAAGASGLEERAEGAAVTLLFYAPAARAAAVYEATSAVLARASALSAPEPVPDRDWSECWKAGLEPIVVSSRLVIRPSFAAHRPAPEQRQLVIDPGQAFGTGGHASTRLALEWIDALVGWLSPGSRVLDVGAGTGILPLAATALTGCRAVACDVDPLAGRVARENARSNGLAHRLELFTGSMRALADTARFDLVVANMLRSELEPLIGDIARCTRRGGRVILAGLLAADCEAIGARARREGLLECAVRHRDDDSAVRWSALLMLREPARANTRAGVRASS